MHVILLNLRQQWKSAPLLGRVPGPGAATLAGVRGAAGGCWGRGTRAGEWRGAALQDVFICNLVLFIVLRRYLIESL